MQDNHSIYEIITSFPPYANRVFTSPDNITEGKNMINTIRHSSSKFELQKGYNRTVDEHIFFTPYNKKGWMEADFVIQKVESRGLVFLVAGFLIFLCCRKFMREK